MAYDMKDVFYLDTAMTIAASTAGDTTKQLDVSSYVETVARGKQKGQGLAIYRVYWSVSSNTDESDPVAEAETAIFRAALLAGAGLGNNATGVLALGADNKLGPSNDNLISGIDFYGGAGAGNTAPYFSGFIDPSDDVPFVVVRDNVCIAASLEANATAAVTISIRMECATVILGTDVLNQLLLTQTA
jgi:hypothetical protein